MIILLSIGVALLAYAALHDIGFRTVPNWVALTLLACGLASRALQHDLTWGLICAAAVFMTTSFVWYFGWLGGADAKLMTASALFVQPALVPQMIVFTSFAGGVLAMFYLIAGRATRRWGTRSVPSKPHGLVARAARCEARRLRRLGPLPYAVAIAAGNWLALANL